MVKLHEGLNFDEMIKNCAHRAKKKTHPLPVRFFVHALATRPSFIRIRSFASHPHRWFAFFLFYEAISKLLQLQGKH
jgi:hypothetical protein